MARDIKVSHSIFALPFALLAVFLARAPDRPSVGQLLLILACMFFARSFAMLSNRYFDRRIDAANPRTAGRALPAGLLRSRDVLVGMAVCAAALAGGAAGFGFMDDNWWPLIFSPLVLAWIGGYGLAKRFTWMCHFILGTALAISPVAAVLAVRPAFLAEPTIWLLAAFVLLWVGGFDVIYALQDLEVDRRQGLRSIPAALGRPGALLLAKLAHLAGFVLLLMAHRSTPLLGQWFFAGCVAVGALLAIEHRAASAGRFHMAFFTLNGVISLVLGAAGIIDLLT
jgi:4-hydroxybenzoate polyprenyltransferase